MRINEISYNISPFAWIGSLRLFKMVIDYENKSLNESE